MPTPHYNSGCCKKNTWKHLGCQVNRGTIDENTPCNPKGGTWMFCEQNGCHGSCGKCECQKLTPLQRILVAYDIHTKTLFYAFQKGEKTNQKIMGWCLFCVSPKHAKKRRAVEIPLQSYAESYDACPDENERNSVPRDAQYLTNRK